VPDRQERPRVLESIIGDLVPRKANIGEEMIIKFEKLSTPAALLAKLSDYGQPGNGNSPQPTDV
jgi:hypothetical protein